MMAFAVDQTYALLPPLGKTYIHHHLLWNKEKRQNDIHREESNGMDECTSHVNATHNSLRKAPVMLHPSFQKIV